VDGDDDFVDPASMDELYSNEAVLLDGIEDHPAGDPIYAVRVMLPDLECDNCTLQLIQVMYDKPPYEVGGNDIYYQCADLVLIEGGAPVEMVDGGTPSGTSDGGAPTGTSDGGAPTGMVDGSGSAQGSGCAAARTKGSLQAIGWWIALLVVWRRLAARLGCP
jgi:hypothetical protein